MFRSIYSTHLLLCSYDDLWPSDELLTDISVLWSFEAIKEVGAEGAVEVDLETGDYGGEEERRVT